MNKALIIAFLLSALFVLSYFAPFANADNDFNYELTRAVPIVPITHDHILLIYSAPFMHFTQGQIMYFITKTVDTRTLTDTLPYDVFNGNQGDLSGANVTVTLEDKQNNTLYTWHGSSNQFGLYNGSIRLLNYPTNTEYHLTFSASKAHFYNYTTCDYFELYDARDVGRK